MRQAITTKFHGPTNHFGARVIAKAAAGRVVHHWDYGLNVEQNHAVAAHALVVKLGWTREQSEGYAGDWVAGSLPTEDGNVYVYAGRTDRLPRVHADGFTV